MGTRSPRNGFGQREERSNGCFWVQREDDLDPRPLGATPRTSLRKSFPATNVGIKRRRKSKRTNKQKRSFLGTGCICSSVQWTRGNHHHLSQDRTKKKTQ